MSRKNEVTLTTNYKELTEAVDNQNHNLKVFYCDLCDSYLAYESENQSMNCPYCGSESFEVELDEAPMIPKSYLKFKRTEKKARKIFKKHYKKMAKIMPDQALADFENISFKKVYWPLWHTSIFPQDAHYSGTAVYYEPIYEDRLVQVYRNGEWEYETRSEYVRSEERHTFVSESVRFQFRKNITASVSDFHEEVCSLMNYHFDFKKFKSDKIEPSDWIPVECPVITKDEAVRITKDEFFEYAHKEMAMRASTLINGEYDLFKPIIHADLYMIPIWVANYEYNNEIYTFLISDDSKEVVGVLPIDEEKKKKVNEDRNLRITAFIVCAVVIYFCVRLFGKDLLLNFLLAFLN